MSVSEGRTGGESGREPAGPAGCRPAPPLARLGMSVWRSRAHAITAVRRPGPRCPFACTGHMPPLRLLVADRQIKGDLLCRGHGGAFPVR